MDYFSPKEGPILPKKQRVAAPLSAEPVAAPPEPLIGPGPPPNPPAPPPASAVPLLPFIEQDDEVRTPIQHGPLAGELSGIIEGEPSFYGPLPLNPTHAILDANGDPSGFAYPQGVKRKVVPLPEGFWDEPHKWDKTAKQWRIDYTELDEQLFLQIDAGAEAFRGKFVTAGSGQMAVYQAKEKEAREFAVLNTPVAERLSKHPYISAEAAAVGEPFEDRAQLILDTANQWVQLSVGIESTRINLKEMVRNATTSAEKKAIAGFVWESILG